MPNIFERPEEEALEESLLPVSDWVDSLIGPSGLLLLVVSPPPCMYACSPSFSFMGGFGKGISKTLNPKP
jgi:hypothetical protein